MPHAKLRRCVAWSLFVRLDMPDIFLNPPLNNFPGDDATLIVEGTLGKVYRTTHQGEAVAVRVLKQQTLDEVCVLFVTSAFLPDLRFQQEHRRPLGEFVLFLPMSMLLTSV